MSTTVIIPEKEGNSYQIRPIFAKRFRPEKVKKVIHKVLVDKLKDYKYDPEEVKNTTTEVVDEIRDEVMDLELDRYKIIVSVNIGEVRGQGVKMGCRCFWDSDSDHMAQDVLMNDSIFCVAAVYGIFHY